jgi:acyl-CoA synthetase (AMP-forming)/AMP-acid ligase II
VPTKAFVGDYYLSGDTVEWNPDGSISFVGRSDDVITTSGYRVGPFDVESALIEHPAVIEAAVVGKPDPERTELVKAFVVLGEQYRATPELAEELRQHVRKRLAAHSYPVKSNLSASCRKPQAANCSALSCATRKSPRLKRLPRRTFQLESKETMMQIENKVFSSPAAPPAWVRPPLKCWLRPAPR